MFGRIMYKNVYVLYDRKRNGRKMS